MFLYLTNTHILSICSGQHTVLNANKIEKQRRLGHGTPCKGSSKLAVDTCNQSYTFLLRVKEQSWEQREESDASPGDQGLVKLVQERCSSISCHRKCHHTHQQPSCIERKHTNTICPQVLITAPWWAASAPCAALATRDWPMHLYILLTKKNHSEQLSSTQAHVSLENLTLNTNSSSTVRLWWENGHSPLQPYVALNQGAHIKLAWFGGIAPWYSAHLTWHVQCPEFFSQTHTDIQKQKNETWKVVPTASLPESTKILLGTL
jgi:hypothetical protein